MIGLIRVLVLIGSSASRTKTYVELHASKHSFAQTQSNLSSLAYAIIRKID